MTFVGLWEESILASPEEHNLYGECCLPSKNLFVPVSLVEKLGAVLHCSSAKVNLLRVRLEEIFEIRNLCKYLTAKH